METTHNIEDIEISSQWIIDWVEALQDDELTSVLHICFNEFHP